MLVTPLQMAELTAMVANGGYRVVPHLLQRRQGAAARARRLRRRRPGRSCAAACRGWSTSPAAPAYGSARLPGIEIAGKSGTVQVIAQAQRIEEHNLPFKYRDHAWFTSFAPVDNPELVVTVFAEHGGGGSKVAAPIAQALYAKYFGIDNGKPPSP